MGKIIRFTAVLLIVSSIILLAACSKKVEESSSSPLPSAEIVPVLDIFEDETATFYKFSSIVLPCNYTEDGVNWQETTCSFEIDDNDGNSSIRLYVSRPADSSKKAEPKNEDKKANTYDDSFPYSSEVQYTSEGSIITVKIKDSASAVSETEDDEEDLILIVDSYLKDEEGIIYSFPCSAEVEDTTEDPVIIINPYVKDRESGLRLSKLLAKSDNEDLKMALVWGEANKILINLPSTVLSVSRSIDSNILSEEIALMETGKYKEALEKLNGRYGNLVPDSFVTGRVDELVLECMIAIEMGLNEKCIHSHTSNGGVVVKACTCSEPGLEVTSCSVCGFELGRKIIPPTGKHAFDEYECTVCGKPRYAIGDIGPAGGIVFYDKGSSSDGWRYLEVAAHDLRVVDGLPCIDSDADGYSSGVGSFIFGSMRNNVGKEVFSNGTTVFSDDCTSARFGSGKHNTELLVSIFGDSAYSSSVDSRKTSFYAARICDALVSQNNGSSFDDWYLPDIEELDTMITNLSEAGIKGFTRDYYWSSSESPDNPNYAMSRYFSDSSEPHEDYILNERKVRPVRRF